MPKKRTSTFSAQQSSQNPDIKVNYGLAVSRCSDRVTPLFKREATKIR